MSSKDVGTPNSLLNRPLMDRDHSAPRFQWLSPTLGKCGNFVNINVFFNKVNVTLMPHYIFRPSLSTDFSSRFPKENPCG